jgi:hypothetical protein
VGSDKLFFNIFHGGGEFQKISVSLGTIKTEAPAGFFFCGITPAGLRAINLNKKAYEPTKVTNSSRVICVARQDKSQKIEKLRQTTR